MYFAIAGVSTGQWFKTLLLPSQKWVRLRRFFSFWMWGNSLKNDDDSFTRRQVCPIWDTFQLMLLYVSFGTSYEWNRTSYRCNTMKHRLHCVSDFFRIVKSELCLPRPLASRLSASINPPRSSNNLTHSLFLSPSSTEPELYWRCVSRSPSPASEWHNAALTPTDRCRRRDGLFVYVCLWMCVSRIWSRFFFPFPSLEAGRDTVWFQKCC